MKPIKKKQSKENKENKENTKRTQREQPKKKLWQDITSKIGTEGDWGPETISVPSLLGQTARGTWAHYRFLQLNFTHGAQWSSVMKHTPPKHAGSVGRSMTNWGRTKRSSALSATMRQMETSQPHATFSCVI
jgi:hypothetical protein